MKKLFCVFLAAIVAISLAACGGAASGSTAPASTPESTPAASVPESTPAASVPESTPAESTPASAPIKIGGTGPLTGTAAIYGTAARDGAQIAVDEINALGGVQFELQYADDEHDAERALNAYNTVKDWGMQISLGSVTTTPGIVTSEENFTDRIFALTPSASSPDVTENKDNVFQMCFADPNQGSASAQYISDQSLGEKIAVIYKNDDAYSTGIYETFQARAGELGLDVVSVTTFTSDSEQDFSVQLADAQTNGADLIFLPMYYTPASLIFQQASAMGYAPKYFGVDGMDGILTLDGFDATLAEGVMLLTPFNADATDERTVSFVEKYTASHGGTLPNQFAADGYDCIYAIYQAVQAGGITASMDAAAMCDILIEQFTTMSFDGLTGGGMTWNEFGQVNKDPQGMVIQDGIYVGMD